MIVRACKDQLCQYLDRRHPVQWQSTFSRQARVRALVEDGMQAMEGVRFSTLSAITRSAPWAVARGEAKYSRGWSTLLLSSLEQRVGPTSHNNNDNRRNAVCQPCGTEACHTLIPVIH